MARKRRTTAFSLSFLDIMACGFGAVTLLFLILRHNEVVVEMPDYKLAAEVQLLEQDIRQAEVEKVELLNSIKELALEEVLVNIEYSLYKVMLINKISFIGSVG